MKTTNEKALKSIRHAAENMGSGNASERAARRLLLQLANALEFGGDYVVTEFAQEFDSQFEAV